MIIQTEEDTTRSCPAFAIDNRLETVTVLHPVGGIYAADITIEYILWSRQKTGTGNECTIFKPGVALSQDETIPVIVRARTIQIPCATEPLCGTGIRNKVVACSCQRGRTYSNSHPERTIRCGGGSEDLALIIPNLPVAAVSSLNERRSEIHREINRLAGSNLDGQWREVLPTDPITTDQYHTIGCLPCTRT